MKILVFTNYYLPGSKAGGSTRAIANVIARLRSEHEFHVVALDRDQGDSQAYAGANRLQWQEQFGCRIFYVRSRSPWSVMRAISGVAPDLVWLNSYFSPFTASYLALRRLRLVDDDVPVLLAPRGELSPETLALKPRKKVIYRALSRAAGLYRGVHYQATSQREFDHIIKIAEGGAVELSPDLLPPGNDARVESLKKLAGELKLAFISRIDNKKNLLFLLKVLRRVAQPNSIKLEIYGPVNAREYWSECESIIAELPPGTAVYRGPLAHSEVSSALSRSHFFVLPTLDENFGYAIAESWQAARPVIISDRTPWRDLAERQVGFDLPLTEAAWLQALDRCLAMDDAKWQQLCTRSLELYARLSTASEDVARTTAMFQAVARSRGRRP